MWMETTPGWVVIGVALFFALFIWVLVRITPGVTPPAPEHRLYTRDEIERHDRFLPKYFLAAAAAVLLGGLQMAVKNYPPLYRWLYEAGYGGHMFRDLANTHIIIVGGGTLLLAALTWYTLPRIIRRPLYSDTLAHMAFWFTVVGVFSFYAALSSLGLVEGELVRHGWTWIAARDHIGVYQEIPMSATASIMGVGYWCFVGNILLSLKAARLVPGTGPDRHLAKFYFVGAGGLLIGTVQGVIQVQPSNVDWLHHAGLAGDFIDPISHAHVNLVTGVCSLIAGITFYLLPRIAPGAVRNRRRENQVFWLLTAGSLIFYVTFLSMGLIMGNLEYSRHTNFPGVAAQLGPLYAVPIGMAGICMVTGFWFFLYQLVRSVTAGGGERTLPALFILCGVVALVIGTFQGPLQAFAPIQLWLDHGGALGDAIPQAHALINIVAGVMIMLMGLSLTLVPEVLGRPIRRDLALVSLAGVWIGTFMYYATTLAFSVIQVSQLQHGQPMMPVVNRYIPVEPVLLMVAGAVVTGGFGAFALAIYAESETYRARAVAIAQALPGHYAGHIHSRVRKRSLTTTLVIEFVGSLCGWPGGGWLYTGHAFQGTLLLIFGPPMAYAILPAVFTPYGGFLAPWGLMPLFLYLPISAGISTGVLAYVHSRELKRGKKRPVKRRSWSPEEIGLRSPDVLTGSYSLNVQLEPQTPGEQP